MRVGRLALVVLLVPSCAPWEAQRLARLLAAEDLRCPDDRLARVARPGRNASLSYVFRCGEASAAYQCQHHAPVTLCRRTD